jgi:hypothetical protein
MPETAGDWLILLQARKLRYKGVVMKIRYQLTWEDYLEAVMLHQCKIILPIKNPLMMGIIFIVATGLSIALFFLGEDPASRIISFMVPFFLGSLTLYRYVFLPRRIRNLFSQQKELSLLTEVELTADAFQVSNAYGSSERPWSDFVMWKENQNLFTLYQSNVLFNILPKRVLTDPDQERIIQEYLTQNNVQQDKKRRFPLWLVLLVLAAVILTLVYQYRAISP